jgi:DNA modification methylase
MSDKITWQDVTVKIGALKPWGGNPKTSTKKDARALLKSWDELGQFQTVAIGPDGDVYDGHQRLSALLVVHGPEYQIAARVSSRSLTDEERRKIAIYSRQIGQWDWDTLSSWQPAELMEWGFDADLLKDWKRDTAALDNFLKSEMEEPTDAEPQIDRAAELNEKWGVVTGDLWQIGPHRLLCGDSTKRDDVERVMGGELCELVVTDPPYGVSYADKNKFLNAISPANRVETPIENDHASKEETQAMWKAAFSEAYKYMKPGAVFYCFMPQGGDQMMMMMMMMSAGIEPRHELIWLKNNHVLGRVDYAYKHEPILYAWKEGGHKFYGGFQTSILEFPKPQISDLHPTMKPVELIQKLIENSSMIDAIVYEPFAGSGTTLVACQNLGRIARAIEISPAYCAVILERMSQAFPSLSITKLD